MHPRVSVVVRTKDRPHFLARALDDVLAQDFDDWETIVVNDGGDRSAVQEVVDRLGERASGRIGVVHTEGPGGRSAAANRGLRLARAPYVVLHDDDDLWDPRFLSRTTAWLDRHPGDAGVVVTTEIVYEEKHGDSYVPVRREPFWEGQTEITYLQLISVNRAVPIGVLYRRSLHDDVGFYDESIDAAEDWEFYLRVTLDHRLGYISGEPLAFWMHRPRQMGADGNSMFALGDIHERADRGMRDAALRAYVREAGEGLPLFLAGLVEVEVRRQIDDALDRHADLMRRELDARHPIWSRVRRGVHRARARRAARRGEVTSSQ